MPRKKRKLRSKLRFAIFMVVLVGIFAGGFVAANNLLWPLFFGGTGSMVGDLTKGDDQEQITELPGMNVLLMGIDERTGDKSQRTDTMILANVNNKDNRVSLLSIPRDTKVNLPRYGVNKINAANLYGGPEMAMDVVSGLTGVSVDYYVITNFNGFKDIVDALGGVTVDVDKDMYHHEDAYGGAYDINLKKGVQELDGTKALMYARYRNDELGDITRTQRQLKLLTAIGDEVMQPSSIIKLPNLIKQTYKNLETNMGLKQMVALGKAARNLDNVQMVSQTMPGWFLDENGVSYWYVDPQKAKQVATALFEEGKVVDVVQGAINNNKPQQVAMEQPKSQNTKATESTKNTPVDKEKQPPDEGAPDTDLKPSGEDEDPSDSNLDDSDKKSEQIDQPPDETTNNGTGNGLGQPDPNENVPKETQQVQIIINTSNN